jgi:hypothetical protein
VKSLHFPVAAIRLEIAQKEQLQEKSVTANEDFVHANCGFGLLKRGFWISKSRLGRPQFPF